MFVLRRYDRSIDRTFRFVSYSENVQSCVTELKDKKAVTIFLENENSYKRAIKLGWIDETKEYNNNLEEEYAKLEKKKLEEKKTSKPKAKATKRKSKTKTSKIKD